MSGSVIEKLKQFIINFRFGATPVFSSVVVAAH